jgi:H+/Cl- antiporter ClcA
MSMTLNPFPYPVPQVQYGYIALEEVFRDSSHMSVQDLSGLLGAKILATSLCVGGGLVGGLFAPSLFIGGWPELLLPPLLL